eukprot:354317-Chlamydomonas_euryale.AAC.3
MSIPTSPWSLRTSCMQHADTVHMGAQWFLHLYPCSTNPTAESNGKLSEAMHGSFDCPWVQGLANPIAGSDGKLPEDRERMHGARQLPQPRQLPHSHEKRV